MKTLGIFAPFWDTLRELADSKRAMIFLLGLVAIANADSVGFEGVRAECRLAAAVFLGAVWIISQSLTDIWAPPAVKPQEPPKPV